MFCFFTWKNKAFHLIVSDVATHSEIHPFFLFVFTAVCVTHFVSQLKLLVLTAHLLLQVRGDCCQRLLPLIVHSILLDDTDGSWRNTLSIHIQDFFSFCSRSAQASSRSATPLNSHSGQLEGKKNHLVIEHFLFRLIFFFSLCNLSDRIGYSEPGLVRQSFSAHNVGCY